MPYIAVVSPIVFGQVERARVKAVLAFLHKDKMEDYSNMKINPELNSKIEQTKERLVSIMKICSKNSLYDTLLENYPQVYL